MGIFRLLSILEPIVEKEVNVSRFSGEVAAVDALGWMHAVLSGCGEELCYRNDKTVFVEKFMAYVNRLVKEGVVPVMVFDGKLLPIKSDEVARRKQKRIKMAQEAKESGDIGAMCRAMEITFDFYIAVIAKLIEQGIAYLIAPYEADAQLAFLSRNGLVDFVIATDGDMLPYGCERMFYSMNCDGVGKYIDRSKVFTNKEIGLTGFTEEMFISMCVLAKCDYLDNIPRVGIKTALEAARQGKTIDGIFAYLERRFVIPEGYRAGFQKAINTFHHQVVFDPVKECQTYLQSPPSSLDLTAHPYLGTIESDQTRAIQLAQCWINPHTGEQTIAEWMERTTRSYAITRSGKRNSSGLAPFFLRHKRSLSSFTTQLCMQMQGHLCKVKQIM